MKKLAMIAYHFPPSAASGTFRSLGFVRHLANLGWQIQVLTVDGQGIETPDAKLLEKTPEQVEVVRAALIDPFAWWARMRKRNATKANQANASPCIKVNDKGTKNRVSLRELFSQFLKTPDNQIGWFLPALLKARLLAKPDIIYSSAPPFTGHLVAIVLKMIWRVPLICDFRDPWLDNPFRQARPSWIDRWEKWLENKVFKKADIVIANTEPMAEAFRVRHPEAITRIHVITNGFDPEDFCDIELERDFSSDELLLVHPGSLYGQRDPRQFLAGLRVAVFEKGCKNLKVQLIGPSENFDGKALQAHVDELELTNHVVIVSSVPHAKALAMMRGADMLLLFSQGTHLQVPAKIFEYMGLGKSIFSVCEVNSATAAIMACLGEQNFSCKNDSGQIASNLLKAYKHWEAHRLAPPAVPTQCGIDIFLRAHLTSKLDGLMCSALGQEAR